jgi:dolichol kinase
MESVSLLQVIVVGVVVGLQVLLIAADKYARGDTGSQLASQLHLLRRTQHCCTGLLLLFLYPLLGHDQSKLFVLIPTVLHAGVDYYRRRINPDFNAWFLRMTGNILRPEEKESRFSASVWFLAGVTCVPFITSHPTAVYLSVLNLSFCDPAASLVGISVPSARLYGKKSLSGSLAAIVTGGVVAWGYSVLFVQQVNVCLAAGIAGVAEFVTLPGVDDNFSIPVFSSVLWEIALAS